MVVFFQYSVVQGVYIIIITGLLLLKFDILGENVKTLHLKKLGRCVKHIVFCKYSHMLNLLPATYSKKVGKGPFLPLWPINFSFNNTQYGFGKCVWTWWCEILSHSSVQGVCCIFHFIMCNIFSEGYMAWTCALTREPCYCNRCRMWLGIVLVE